MPPESAGPLTYGLLFRNPTAGPLEACEVRHRPPAGAEVVGATAGAALRDGEVVWDLGDVPAGAARRLSVTVRVPPGWVPPAAADFRLTQRSRSVMRVPVVRPAVTLTATAGPGVVGRPLGVEVVVENTGNGPLEGAALTAALPDGMTGPDAVPLPAIPAGGRHSARLEWLPASQGEFAARLTVAGGGLVPPAVLDLGVVVGPVPLRMEWSPPGPLTTGVTADAVLTVDAAPDVGPAILMVGGSDTLDVGGLPDGPVPLAPGRTTIPVRLTARAPGPFRLAARAEAGDESAECELEGTAVAPPVGALERILAGIDASLPGASAPPAGVMVAVAPRHVVFRLGGEDFGLPLESVREAMRPVEVTPVPHAPEWLSGVAGVRGDIVSVSDLAAYLGVAGSPGAAARLLVVRSSGGEVTAGLLVDAVVGLRSFAADELRAPPATGGRLGAALAALADAGGRPVALLDPDRLLLSDEFRPESA